MAGGIPSHEYVQKDYGAPVLDKVAIQTPSPSIFSTYTSDINEKQDSPKSSSEEHCLQPAGQTLEDCDMDVAIRTVHSSSPNVSEDVPVLSQGEDSSQSTSLELLPQSPNLSKAASSTNFIEDPGLLEGRGVPSLTSPCLYDLSMSGMLPKEDKLCNARNSAEQGPHSASASMNQGSKVQLEEEEVSGHVETFGCLEDDDLLSMDDIEDGSSRESQRSGPEVLWTEESALLSKRSEGSLTEDSELHPEILKILHRLFSRSSGKPFQNTLRRLCSTLGGIRACGFNVWLEKVAFFNAGDELLVIVHWSNMYLFEGGLCLIHGKGLALRNEKITWQVQKCITFGTQTPQEIYSIVLKERDRIVSACPENDTSNTVRECHGEQVYTEYSVIKIAGDGRCLFRAVAHGFSLRCGEGAPDWSQQTQLADDLRLEVADELVKRRHELEWFIEGDFDVYVNRIRQPFIWGGETEVLMLTYVLEVPITVYLNDQNTVDGIVPVCKYGQEYGNDNPIRVLYDGCAHYEALQVKEEETM